MCHPALTTRASERMKTRRFSYVAGFAARERMREAKPVKARKSGVQPLFRHAERSRAWPLLLSLSKTAMGRLEFKWWEKRSSLKRCVAVALAERGPAKGGRGVPSFQLHRQAGTARRDDGLVACRPGGSFLCFTPRGVSSATRRGAAPPVCCYRKRRLCAAPRGMLRWRGARGALRVLFFLGVSPPAKKSTRKRSQALLFIRGGQPPIGQKQP